MSQRRSRSLVRRTLTGVVTLGVLVVVGAGPAAAHVTVKSTEATKGGYAKLTVRVPTESDTASTTKVQLGLPKEHPLASVRIKAADGWTATMKKSKLPAPVKVGDQELTEAVTEISWVADGDAGVKPGEFQEFDVSVGPLPDADSMTFKAVQTYSDGKVVRWIEESTEGGEEPEFPAPVLTLGAAAGHGAAPTAAAAATDTAPVAKQVSTDSSSAALPVAIAGLLAGIGGLVLGALAFAAARRRPTGPSPA